MVKKCRLHYKTHHHRIYVGCYVDDVDDDDNVIGKSHIIGEEEAEPLGEYKTNIDEFVPLFMENNKHIMIGWVPWVTPVVLLSCINFKAINIEAISIRTVKAQENWYPPDYLCSFLVT